MNSMWIVLCKELYSGGKGRRAVGTRHAASASPLWYRRGCGGVDAAAAGWHYGHGFGPASRRDAIYGVRPVMPMSRHPDSSFLILQKLGGSETHSIFAGVLPGFCRQCGAFGLK